MTNSHTPEWERVRELENVKGLLALIDTSRKAIKQLAWGQGDHSAIFWHSEQQRREIERLRALWRPLYEKWLKEARDGSNDA